MKVRAAFENDFLDAVTITLKLSDDLCIQRSSLWKCPNLLQEKPSSFRLPLFPAGPSFDLFKPGSTGYSESIKSSFEVFFEQYRGLNLTRKNGCLPFRGKQRSQ